MAELILYCMLSAYGGMLAGIALMNLLAGAAE